MSPDPRLLFINPWIHDFAAHDFWSKPLGLLRIAEYLSHYPVHIDWIDVMDRFHPSWQTAKTKPAAHGKYHREELVKPAFLPAIPRQYSRYGAEKSKVRAHMLNLKKPDLIFMATHLTYWYGGVGEAVDLCRELFPDVPIITGGIYATLMPDHIRQALAPDLNIEGPGEAAALAAVNRFCSTDFQDHTATPFIRRSWIHYPVLKSLPFESSHGCPYQCSFCASKLLLPSYSRYDTGDFIRYFLEMTEIHAVRDVVFYDDALLLNSDSHIKPILRTLASERPGLQIHTPNGLFARFIDAELARLMRRSGFVMPRLSLESSDADIQNRSSRKVNNSDYRRAIRHLQQAGYAPGQYLTYIISGLPGQTLGSIRASIDFAHEQGSRISIPDYSPIPGTEDFIKSGFPEEADPLLLNNSVYPYLLKPELRTGYEELRRYAKMLNDRLPNVTG